MSDNIEMLRRILAEQKKITDLVQRASPKFEIERALALVDPMRQFHDQNVFYSNIEKAVEAAKNPIAHYFQDDDFQKIINGQSVALEVEKAQRMLEEQRALLNSAYEVVKQTGNQASELFTSIRNPIDEIIRFHQSHDYERITELTYKEISSFVDPLYERFRDITSYINELEEEIINAPDKKGGRRSPKEIAKWLIVISLALNNVEQIVDIWGSFQNQQGTNTTLSIDLKGKGKILFEQRQVISQKIGHAVSDEFYSAITTTKVKLRSGPSTNNDKLTTLPPRTHFLVTGENGEWASGFASLED
ncbi:hypothetical protein HNQ57_003560, partial [Zhongshania antarctica]